MTSCTKLARPALVTLFVGCVLSQLAADCWAQQASRRQRRSNTATNSNVDQRIGVLRQEFPEAQLRITGRERTPHRQAELMYERAQRHPATFSNVYGHRPYGQEMATWVRQNPNAPNGVEQFESIINEARQQGYRVSNHLPSPDGSVVARDLSAPPSPLSPEYQDRLEQRIREMCGEVLREQNPPHWHVDFDRNCPTSQPNVPAVNVNQPLGSIQDSPAIMPRAAGQSAGTASLKF
jgi:hypothetical protein